MSKRVPANKFSHEDFLRKFYKDDWNKDYEIISKYTKMLDKIMIRHSVCGYEFQRIASKTTPRVKCPKCYKSSRNKRTHSMFLNEIEELVGDEYTVTGKYINTDTKVGIMHNVCGHDYEVEPNSFLNAGSRCPKCAGVIKLTNNEFLSRIENLEYREEYQFNEEYNGYDTKISVTHLRCGNTYSVTPNKFIAGRRCPKCNSSKGEKRISYFLDKSNVKYIKEKTFDDLLSNGVRLRYDFYIPSINTLIEYDGSQHFRVKTWGSRSYNESLKILEGIQSRDRIKDEYALKNDINLIRIKYTEYDNIEEILKSLLLE